MIVITWFHVLNYSINKATLNFKEHKSDNFYELEHKQIKKKGVNEKIYLFINKLLYRHYKFIMGDFNEKTSQSLLKLLKPFGPTFYPLIMTVVMSYQ